MRAAFSEFSYGFAFTYSFLKNLPGIRSAPVLPSLLSEGQQGGFDLKLDYPGMPVFFQFKLSDYLIRSNAKLWQFYGRPYYRVEITSLRRSKQHNLLKRLATNVTRDVFYAAPLFTSAGAFNQAFLADEVDARSAWISLERLPYLKDYGQHYVTFADPHRPKWNTTEPPEELDADFSSEHLLADVRRRIETRNIPEITRSYLERLREDLTGIVRAEELTTLVPQFRTSVDRPELLRDIQFLLTTFLNASMVILQPA
ncbi:MAG: hypothetical protein HYY00_05455 [Chloroflexi bacterium]|nr:hypothetical protein [Chloroflexota bacterium]